jgi:hypothetical protein
MSKFFTLAEKDRRDAERATFLNGEARRTSSGAAASSLTPQNPGHGLSVAQGQPLSPLREIHPRSEQYDNHSYYQSGPSQPIPTQHERSLSSSGPSPSTLQGYAQSPNIHPAQPPAPKEKEADSPYKAEMVSRMDSLKRGERIIPPCDRCRRLHMDCVKNLTACQGCTKKHAKCSWRDVRQSEVFGPDAGKVPIPSAEVEGEREPSVGFRPDERGTAATTSPQSTTPDSMQHQQYTPGQGLHDPPRYDSGQYVPPRTESSRMGTEDTLSHIERAAATAAAAVSHSDNGVFGERRDGHQPMIA